LLPISVCPDGIGDQGMLTVGADDKSSRLGRRGLASFMTTDPDDAAPLPYELIDQVVLPDLCASRTRGLDEDRVQQRPARAVESVNTVVERKPAVQDDASRIESDSAGRRRPCCDEPLKQSPPVEQSHAWHLQLVGGQRVTRKPCPVDRKYPQSLAGEQHRGCCARYPSTNHDHVVASRRHPASAPNRSGLRVVIAVT